MSEHVDTSDVVGLEVVETRSGGFHIVDQNSVKTSADRGRHGHVVLLVDRAQISETSVDPLDRSGSFLSHQSLLDSAALFDGRLFAARFFDVGAHAVHLLGAGLVLVVQGWYFDFGLIDLEIENNFY